MISAIAAICETDRGGRRGTLSINRFPSVSCFEECPGTHPGVEIVVTDDTLSFLSPAIWACGRVVDMMIGIVRRMVDAISFDCGVSELLVMISNIKSACFVGRDEIQVSQSFVLLIRWQIFNNRHCRNQKAQKDSYSYFSIYQMGWYQFKNFKNVKMQFLSKNFEENENFYIVGSVGKDSS